MGWFAFGAGGVDSALGVGAGVGVPCVFAFALFASVGLGTSVYSASNHSSHSFRLYHWPCSSYPPSLVA
eukprot:1421084-Rhodomonas_salina.1